MILTGENRIFFGKQLVTMSHFLLQILRGLTWYRNVTFMARGPRVALFSEIITDGNTTLGIKLLTYRVILSLEAPNKFGKSIPEFGERHSSVLGRERRPVSASIMSRSCFVSFFHFHF